MTAVATDYRGVGMAKKRGRPPVGPTQPIRIPEDVYQMLVWIGAVQKKKVTRVAEEVMTHAAVAKYLEMLPRIKSQKANDDYQAEQDGREPDPLPEIKVLPPGGGDPVPPEDIPDDVYAKIKDPGRMPYFRDSHQVLDNEIDQDQPAPKQPPKKKRP